MVRSVDTDIARAKEKLADMEAEARGYRPATRRALGSKIRTYRESLNGIQDDLRRVRGRAERGALLGSGGDADFSDKSRGQRGRMMESNTRMAESTSRLEDARRQLHETEHVAMDVVSELGRNRETLESARRKVRDVSSTTDVARRVLRSMTTRELRFKLMMALFVLIVLALIGVVIYFAFFNNGDSKSG